MSAEFILNYDKLGGVIPYDEELRSKGEVIITTMGCLFETLEPNRKQL